MTCVSKLSKLECKLIEDSSLRLSKDINDFYLPNKNVTKMNRNQPPNTNSNQTSFSSKLLNPDDNNSQEDYLVNDLSNELVLIFKCIIFLDI